MLVYAFVLYTRVFVYNVGGGGVGGGIDIGVLQRIRLFHSVTFTNSTERVR